MPPKWVLPQRAVDYESCLYTVEKPGVPPGNGVHFSATSMAMLMEKVFFRQAGGHRICSLEVSRHEKES